jgi:hypothetical protein
VKTKTLGRAQGDFKLVFKPINQKISSLSLSLSPTFSHHQSLFISYSRASFYGLDGWSIHKGSCGLGYQWPDLYPGFDTVAIADASPEFGGSCGKCFEVKCRNADFTDGYGSSISRSSACFDSSKSLVVRTVDACPCVYPGNQYSNKRWCCGDQGSGSAHMDLSIWAFEKLADKSLGVVGISYRQVPCDFQPSNPAPALSNPSPAEPPYEGAKRPDQKIFVQRFDDLGKSQAAVSTISDPSQADGKPIVSVDTLYQDGTYNPLDNSGSSSSSSPSSSSSSTDNGCTDTAPTDGTTCQQQKDGGNCNQNWILSGNYCRATCDRCTVSSSESSDSSCWDQQPSSGGDCNYQKKQGNCDEGWLKSGGFCKKTCGACSDSSDTYTVSSFDGSCWDQQPSSGGDCNYQKKQGNCEEDWLKSGGFCKKTCGACS